MRPFCIIAVLAVALVTGQRQASAQRATCGPRDAIIASITGPQWREAPMLELGGNTGEGVTWIYANFETGTWSWLATPPPGSGFMPGTVCIVATGKSIEPMGQPKNRDTKS